MDYSSGGLGLGGARWSRKDYLAAADQPCPHGRSTAAYCTECMDGIAAAREAEEREDEVAELREEVEHLRAQVQRLLEEGGPGRGNENQ